jgi:toxin HigB-1
VIRSFADEETRKFWETGKSTRNPPANIRNAAKRKLLMLDAAVRLEDLRVPPGNKLHALQGDRAHQRAIWINDQYRLCFTWKETDAYDVEITDYH